MEALDSDTDEETIHDQLPSVEAYKAGSGFRSSSKRPDPVGPAASSLLQAESEEMKTFEDLEIQEEFDAGMAEFKGANYVAMRRVRCWKICAVVSTVLLVIVVTFGVVLSNTGKELPWLNDTARYKAVENYFIVTGLSASEDLADPNSPQHLAAKWLANKDGMKMPVPKVGLTVDHLAFVERYVLAVFYYATGGPNWKNQLNFLNDDHVCTWYQTFLVDSPDAQLDDEYVTYGVHGCKSIGDELVPFTLFLPDNGLKGTLPYEMYMLDRLEVMNLQFNAELEGELPASLSNMEKLRHLALQWCGFSGSIPSWIGQMTGLKFLGLSNNKLVGRIPEEIAGLTNLELLGLDDNDLSANIELFHKMEKLKSLYLEDNRISGEVTDALLASWPRIEELDLSNNDLEGALSENLFSFQSLKVLDLSNNNFRGELPAPKTENFQLEYLALQDNDLQGPIPAGIQRLKAITHLDLSRNSFSSTITESIGALQQLKYLFLATNPFDMGPMPTFLEELMNLQELSLKSTRRTGPIPESLQELKKLEFLDLHNNELTGTIPEKLGSLTGLKHLLLKDNQLSGTLPAEFGRLSNLDVVLLEQNNLTGDADAICDGSPELQKFVSDCQSEMTCRCCDTCCSDDNKTCNAGEWSVNLDPIWEYGYRRGRYSYQILGPQEVVFP